MRESVRVIRKSKHLSMMCCHQAQCIQASLEEFSIGFSKVVSSCK